MAGLAAPERDPPNPSERNGHAEDSAGRGFMQQALDQARKALDLGEVPVGCVFVHEGAVIGTGHNRTNLEFNATRHAEVVAIDEILLHSGGAYDASIFSQCDLYVTCEPCIMCAAALAEVRVRRVFFGCHNYRFGGCGSVLKLHEGKSVVFHLVPTQGS